MDARRCRQVIVTLAFSLFVLCATHQVSGLVVHHIIVLLSLLVFTGLILFVVHHRSTLCSVVRVCFGELAGLLSVPAIWRGSLKPTSAIYAPSDAFVRCFRFQLPPPILSL
jgi:hypothetical protein